MTKFQIMARILSKHASSSSSQVIHSASARGFDEGHRKPLSSRNSDSRTRDIRMLLERKGTDKASALGLRSEFIWPQGHRRVELG